MAGDEPTWLPIPHDSGQTDGVSGRQGRGAGGEVQVWHRSYILLQQQTLMSYTVLLHFVVNVN